MRLLPKPAVSVFTAMTCLLAGAPLLTGCAQSCSYATAPSNRQAEQTLTAAVASSVSAANFKFEVTSTKCANGAPTADIVLTDSQTAERHEATVRVSNQFTFAGRQFYVHKIESYGRDGSVTILLMP